MVTKSMKRPNVGGTTYNSRMVAIGMETVSLNALYAHLYLAN